MVIQPERQQLGVVHRGIDPRVVAVVARPLLVAQRTVFTAHSLKLRGFTLTHLSRRQRLRVQLLQALACAQDQGNKLFALLQTHGVCRWQPLIGAPLARAFLLDKAGK